MMRRLLFLAGVGLLLGGWVSLAGPAGAGDSSPVVASDTLDVVFLGDTRPVFLRLHVLIDGRPYPAVYQAAWDDYLKALFRQLDQDGDGFLSEAEAQRLPPPQLSGGAAGRPTHLAFNFRVVDADGNGKLDLSELAAYYRDYGGAGLLVSRASPPRLLPGGNGTVPRLIVPAVSSPVNEALFNRLDTNRDGKLSQEELAAAEAVLMPLDLDGDEVLTLAEIASRPALPPADQVPLPPAVPLSPTNSPFVFLNQGVDGALLARRLLDRYGGPGAAKGRKLGRDDLGLDADTFRRLDANHDGALDVAELEKFADLPPDLEVRVRLGQMQPGESPLEIMPAAGRPSPQAWAVRPSGDGTLLLSCGHDRIELRANEGRPMPVPRLRQVYLDQFLAADSGKKGYLTFKEAQTAGFFPGQFTLLDQNGDGRLTEKELLAYLDQVQERQARAVTSAVSVLVSDEGHGLFELLDRNCDGRLGLREIRAASMLLAQLGREKEGLTPGDVPHSYQVALGLCQASFNRTGGHGVFSPPGMPLLALDWSPPDLIWFDKMDRNHDGDVSLREFLGSREDFQRIDSNGDGLISREEALQAEKLFRKPARNP